MPEYRLPLVVLAGRDRNATPTPEKRGHSLKGEKALEIRIGGRPLIDLLIESLAAADAFGPLFIAGPAALYGEGRAGATTIDTDGTFGDNIRASLEQLRVSHPGQPIAFSSCDILPDPADLCTLVDDYRAHRPLDFWFPLILVPDDPTELGASAYKPTYRIVPEEATATRTVLPGHLIVVDPEALRRRLIYSSFELAYASRGRPVLHRLRYIVGHLLPSLLRQEMLRMAALRPPTFTASLVWNGTLLARRLQAGTIDQRELEDRLRRIFVTDRHRRRYPDRRGRIAPLAALSIAKDIDTREEAEERAAERAGGARQSDGDPPPGDRLHAS